MPQQGRGKAPRKMLVSAYWYSWGKYSKTMSNKQLWEPLETKKYARNIGYYNSQPVVLVDFCMNMQKSRLSGLHGPLVRMQFAGYKNSLL
jgi:hypothetical protein